MNASNSHDIQEERRAVVLFPLFRIFKENIILARQKNLKYDAAKVMTIPRYIFGSGLSRALVYYRCRENDQANKGKHNQYGTNFSHHEWSIIPASLFQ